MRIEIFARSSDGGWRAVDQLRKGMDGVGEAGDLPNVRQNGQHSTMHCSCDVVECDKGKESFRHGKTLDVPASADHDPRKAVQTDAACQPPPSEGVLSATSSMGSF